MPGAREGNETKDESGRGRAARACSGGPGLNRGSFWGARLLNHSLTKLPPALSSIALSQVEPIPQDEQGLGAGIKNGERARYRRPLSTSDVTPQFCRDALGRECRLATTPMQTLTSPGHSKARNKRSGDGKTGESTLPSRARLPP